MTNIVGVNLSTQSLLLRQSGCILNDAAIQRSYNRDNQLHVVDLQLLQLLTKLVRLITFMLPVSLVPLYFH